MQVFGIGERELNMRHELLEPPVDEALLREIIDLANSAYRKFEAGQDVSHIVDRLAQITNTTAKDLSYQLKMAFGSVSPETFARSILTNWDALPSDLSNSEMLELVERFYHPRKGQEFLNTYWLKCLKLNTGNNRISDLIFWPDRYFGATPPANALSLSPAEVLEIALRDGKPGK
jgi:hypothetical protein